MAVNVASHAGNISSRNLFVGYKIPEEIGAMISLSNNIDKSSFRTILAVTVAALEGKPTNHSKLKDLCSTAKLSEDTVFSIASGLYRLLQLALRQTSLKSEIVTEDLVEMKLSKEFIPDVVSAVFGTRRQSLLKHAAASCPSLPKLKALKWRVDVAISTSVLNRVLEPAVMMEMTLCDGKMHSFEVPVSKFHELRYNVAYILKEMEDMEKRSILKIQD